MTDRDFSEFSEEELADFRAALDDPRAEPRPADDYGQNTPSAREVLVRRAISEGKPIPKFKDMDPDEKWSFRVALVIMAGLPIGFIIWQVVKFT